MTHHKPTYKNGIQCQQNNRIKVVIWKGCTDQPIYACTKMHHKPAYINCFHIYQQHNKIKAKKTNERPYQNLSKRLCQIAYKIKPYKFVKNTTPSSHLVKCPYVSLMVFFSDFPFSCTALCKFSSVVYYWVLHVPGEGWKVFHLYWLVLGLILYPSRVLVM